MKNVLTPTDKSVSVLLGLTAAASTTHAAIQRKIFYVFLFVGMLLDTLAASLLESALAGKGVVRHGDGVIRVSHKTNRAGQGF